MLTDIMDALLRPNGNMPGWLHTEGKYKGFIVRGISGMLTTVFVQSVAFPCITCTYILAYVSYVTCFVFFFMTFLESNSI